MKIFIIGKSGKGKTTFAKKLANKVSGIHIELPALDINLYKEEPDISLLFLHREINKSNSLPVIDGIINPKDFIITFDPTSDLVILLNNHKAISYEDKLDTGIDIIKKYMEWQVVNLLISPKQFLNCSVLDFHCKECKGKLSEVLFCCLDNLSDYILKNILES